MGDLNDFQEIVTVRRQRKGRDLVRSFAKVNGKLTFGVVGTP